MAREAELSLLKLTIPLRIRVDRGDDDIDLVQAHCHRINLELSDELCTEGMDVDTRVGRGELLQVVEDLFQFRVLILHRLK